MPNCEPVGLDFVKRARVVAKAEATVAASPAQVWQVLNDTEGWPTWFDGMKSARVTSPSWDGVGSTRVVQVGPMKVHEHVIAWEPDVQWGFYVTELNLLGYIAKRFLEIVDIEPVGSGSKVSYTGAIDPVPWLIPVGGLLKKRLESAWTASLPNIDNQIT